MGVGYRGLNGDDDGNAMGANRVSGISTLRQVTAEHAHRKQLATQLAASRREALELRTLLEHSVRKNKAGVLLTPNGGVGISTFRVSHQGTDSTLKANGNANANSIAIANPKTPNSASSKVWKKHLSCETASLAETNALGDALRQELAFANARIETLQEENDELRHETNDESIRRFATRDSGNGSEGRKNGFGNDDVDVHHGIADEGIAVRVGDDNRSSPSAQTLYERKRLLQIVNSSPLRLNLIDLVDGVETAVGTLNGDQTQDSSNDSSDDNDDASAAFHQRQSTNQSPHLVPALRAELIDQANAIVILEDELEGLREESQGLREELRVSTTALSDSKIRELELSRNLQVARQDALGASAIGEEVVRFCVGKVDDAEAGALLWETEAKRLQVVVTQRAETRLVAVADRAAAAAARERNEVEMGTAVGAPPVLFSNHDRMRKQSDDEPRFANTWNPVRPNETPRTTGSTRDSPFAASEIFADQTPGSSTPTSKHRTLDPDHWLFARTPLHVGRYAEQSVMYNRTAVANDEKKDAPSSTHETPGALLQASLARQSATLDLLRSARARRDRELKRVRDRLDKLVASPRRVGMLGSYAVTPTKIGYEAGVAARAASPQVTQATSGNGMEAAALTSDEDTTNAGFDLAREKRTKLSRVFFGSRKTLPADDGNGEKLDAAEKNSEPKSLTRDADKNIPPPKQSSVRPQMPNVMPSMSIGRGFTMPSLHKAAATIQAAWREKKST